MAETEEKKADKAVETQPEVKGKAFTFYTQGIGIQKVEVKGKPTEYYVTGYAATDDIDLVNDMVTPEAMKGMLGQINNGAVPVKIDIEHEGIDPVTGKIKDIIPVGKTVEGKLDSRGMWIKVKLNSAIERFKDVWGSVKNGFLDAFSITFRVKDREFRMINGKKTRVIHRVDLMNIGLTGSPINQAATITEVFAKAIQHEEQLDTGEKRKKVHSAKWERCVRAVKKQGGVRSPEAVCTAALGAESFKSTSMRDIVASTKTLMEGGNTMATEQKDETPEPEAPAEETPAEETNETPAEDAPAEEKPAEEKPAEETPAEEPETEGKAITELKAKMKAVEKKNTALEAELKALKELPILKAAGPDAAGNEPPAADDKPITPLSMISS